MNRNIELVDFARSVKTKSLEHNAKIACNFPQLVVSFGQLRKDYQIMRTRQKYDPQRVSQVAYILFLSEAASQVREAFHLPNVTPEDLELWIGLHLLPDYNSFLLMTRLGWL